MKKLGEALLEIAWFLGVLLLISATMTFVACLIVKGYIRDHNSKGPVWRSDR